MWNRGASVFFACVGALALGACRGETIVYGDAGAFDHDPPQAGSMVGKIVTTNNGDDTLSILDPHTPGPPLRMPVGFNPVELEGPHHLSVDPAGRFVYVNLSLAVLGSASGPHGAHGMGDMPGYMVKLDARTGQEVGRRQVEANPGDNAISPDGRTLYVTHYDILRWHDAAHGDDYRAGDSTLVAIDTDTMTVKARLPICPAAHGVRLSADGKRLFATCGPDEIADVDLSGATPVARRVLLPGGTEGGSCQACPYAIGVAPDGIVWVSSLGPANGSQGRGQIDLYDPKGADGGAFLANAGIRLRGSPLFAAFSQPGTDGSFRAYVPEQGGPDGDAVRVYARGAGGGTLVEVAVLTLGREECLNAHMMLVDGNQGQLICEGNHVDPGRFVWLDLDPLAVRGSTAIGVFPDGVALVPRGAR